MVPLNLSASTSVASKSGDASAGLTVPLNYGGAFQVGGRGNVQDAKSTQDTSAEQSGVSKAGNNMLVYVALGVVGLVVIVSLLRVRPS